MPELFTPSLLDDAHQGLQDDPGREGPNALTTEEATQGLLDDGPQLSTTRAALPIGGATSGDGGAQSAPQPPEAPEFPRMDVPTDAPQKDGDARRQDRIMALLGALGATAAAAGDDPVMLSAAGGLAEGASQDLQRRRETFAERQQAFQEMVTEAEKHNRRVRQKEIEAGYERRLSAFEQDRKDRRQRAEATQERIEAEREHERTLEQIRERGRQQRQTDAFQDVLEDDENGGSDDGGVTLPDTVEDTQRQIDEMVRKAQQAHEQGASSSELGSMQDDILRLKEHRDSLLQRQRQPRDTTRTDSTGTRPTSSRRTTRDSTAAPSDSTASADTTTTRNLGRSPGFVSAGQIGMTSGGGNPGGGSNEPSARATQLDPALGGSGDYTQRSTERLVDDALTVAWERGPDEARRRLDELARQGRLDDRTARTVRRRMELVRGYDRIAVQQSPKAALDSLAADLERGDVTPAEAERLADRLADRYSR